MATQIGLENQHICHFMPSARVADCSAMFTGNTGNPHSDHVALRGAQRAIFLIIVNDVIGATAGLQNASIRCAACFTSAGACTTQKVSFRYRVISASDTQGAIGEAYSVSFGGTSNRILEIEVDADTLAEVSTGGWEYVQLLVSAYSGVYDVQGACVAILQGLRHKRNVLGTQMT